MNFKFKPLIITALLTPLFLFCIEEEKEHAPVGSRNSETTHECLDKEKQPFLFQNETQQEEPKERASCGFLFDSFSPQFYSSPYHWIYSISEYSEVIEIEDGSIWKSSSYDRHKGFNWSLSDHIIITQNTSWFSNYKYRLINKNTGSSMDVNLQFGPLVSGEYTRYISSIDQYRGLVILTDGSYWEVCPSDLGEFSQWLLNDVVIVGLNSGWHSSYEGLLINVNLNKFIRAKQY